MSTACGFTGTSASLASGHLPQTIVALVRQSPAGLTAAQLGQSLHLDPRSFLWQFHEHPALQREKYQGHFVYFAAETALATGQKAARAPLCLKRRCPRPPKPSPFWSWRSSIPSDSPQELCARLRPTHPHLTPAAIASPLRPPRPDAKKNADSAWLDCLSAYRQQLCQQTTSAALFARPPLIDFTTPPPLPEPSAAPWQVLKTTTRKVVTLAIGEFSARETLWWHPTTDQVCPAPALRRLVAPACNYGYDVVVYVGRALFLDAQPVRQIMSRVGPPTCSLERQHRERTGPPVHCPFGPGPPPERLPTPRGDGPPGRLHPAPGCHL